LKSTHRKSQGKVMTARANRILAENRSTNPPNQTVHVKTLMDGSEKSE